MVLVPMLYCTFGHDPIFKMRKRAVDTRTCTHYILNTYISAKTWDVGRGRKSYFVHNMRQDVAILCSKSNTIATSLFRAHSWREKDNHTISTAGGADGRRSRSAEEEAGSQLVRDRAEPVSKSTSTQSTCAGLA